MVTKEAPLHSELSEAPNDGRASWLQSGDGVHLRFATWSNISSTLGTVFIFPGRSDYIEMFGAAVSDFVEEGYAVAVVDWRGHGLSQRVAEDPYVGHVSCFLDYQTDVSAVVSSAKELGLPEPWYLIGHSMGAAIALRSLSSGMPVAASVFTAPMWGINLPWYERLVAKPASWFAKQLGKGEAYAPGVSRQSYVQRNPFEGNKLTTSLDNYNRWAAQGELASELHTGGPSFGWLYAALGETRKLSKIASPSVPSIAFYGDEEAFVSVQAIHDRMARWPNGKLVPLANCRHEILLETREVRQEVVRQACGLFAEHR
ncbi:lysophospholipase [Roseivivax sediminis]|uniref:Lysophospholipase n=2 Tax=Roseivivax sediminis TaxID=936889 RepID=A0A1I2E6H5_9RHOB|nr:lysophospholipase [Roseivivax sediminis]